MCQISAQYLQCKNKYYLFQCGKMNKVPTYTNISVTFILKIYQKIWGENLALLKAMEMLLSTSTEQSFQVFNSLIHTDSGSWP